jgi:hypothetical protein
MTCLPVYSSDPFRNGIFLSVSYYGPNTEHPRILQHLLHTVTNIYGSCGCYTDAEVLQQNLNYSRPYDIYNSCVRAKWHILNCCVMKLIQPCAIKWVPTYITDRFLYILRDIEVDFNVNSLLTEVKKKLLISWMSCIWKHSNLGVHISLVNKVTVVLMKLPKHWHFLHGDWSHDKPSSIDFCPSVSDFLISVSTLSLISYVFSHFGSPSSPFFQCLNFLCTQRICIAMCVTHIINLASLSYCSSLQILYFILFPPEVHHPGVESELKKPWAVFSVRTSSLTSVYYITALPFTFWCFVYWYTPSFPHLCCMPNPLTDDK